MPPWPKSIHPSIRWSDPGFCSWRTEPICMFGTRSSKSRTASTAMISSSFTVPSVFIIR